MDAATYPVLWVGPAGSGKLTAARTALGSVNVEPRLQTLEIGDYSARFWEFPTHMEIDITDLSMMDKQILPEMINQLLSTRDVIGGKRKMMILRHIHGLSPAAAVRLRACMEELVWMPNAPAMIWATARVVNPVVSTFMDGFVYKRVPGERIDLRTDRALLMEKVGASGGLPPHTMTSYIAEMLRQMVVALEEGPPCLEAAKWIRGRIYDLLGLMMTGSELVSGLLWATLRLAATGSLSDKKARAVLNVLSRARWIPSYRTPLMLEMIVVSVYNALAAASALETTYVEVAASSGVIEHIMEEEPTIPVTSRPIKAKASPKTPKVSKIPTEPKSTTTISKPKLKPKSKQPTEVKNAV